jgi:hypothetical protein
MTQFNMGQSNMDQSNPPTFGQPIQAAMPEKTSTLAIVGLILGILGFCTGGLLGLVGLILGIIAIVSINKSQGRIGGSGLAIATIVVSAFSLVVGCAILPGLFLPALGKARLNAQNLKSQAMLQQLNGAILIYAADHNDQLPPSNDWLAALQTVSPQASTFADSVTSKTPSRAYAMNTNLDGVKLSAIPNANRTVVLFEVGPGAPLAGGEELLPAQPRFSQGYLILFADGHTENVKPANVNTLVWSP